MNISLIIGIISLSIFSLYGISLLIQFNKKINEQLKYLKLVIDAEDNVTNLEWIKEYELSTLSKKCISLKNNLEMKILLSLIESKILYIKNYEIN